MPRSQMAKDIVYTHHERWDGTGYPQGLRGADIPVAGRVMAVVDVYDAATPGRCIEPAMSHDETVDVDRPRQGHALRPGGRRRIFSRVSDRFKSASEEAIPS